MNQLDLAKHVRHLALTLICVSLLAGLGLYIRWPVTRVDTFRNEDVAGITYNSDLLRHGKVPLVDNLEYKAPGSFFLVYGVWTVWGRSITVLEVFGMAWALLAGLGVFFGGRLMFGWASGLLAGLIYTIYAPISDSMTVNYNTWMITAYVWCTVFFIAGLKRGSLRWFVLCGVTLAWAALFKRQAGVLFPIFPLVLWLAPRLGLPPRWRLLRREGQHRRAIYAFLGGLAVGFGALGVYFLAAAGLEGVWAYVKHFFLSGAGWRYVGGELDATDKFYRLEDAFTGFYQFMLLPTVLACLTIVSVPQERRRGWALLGLLLGGHLLLSFVGLSLGFRFYKGYYLHALPAAAWLAAHQDGPILRWFHPRAWPEGVQQRLSRVFVVLLVAVLCMAAGERGYHGVKQERRKRTNVNSYQMEAVRIARHVREHTSPDDRIWVWGRWAWPVYYHADRLSVTPFYKVLGVITNNLTNTWKRPTEMTRFVPLGPHVEIGRQLARGKPAFIVTANNEDYTGFTQLEELLSKDYEPVQLGNITAFRCYRRKGHRPGPRPAKKARQ